MWERRDLGWVAALIVGLGELVALLVSRLPIADGWNIQASGIDVATAAGVLAVAMIVRRRETTARPGALVMLAALWCAVAMLGVAATHLPSRGSHFDPRLTFTAVWFAQGVRGLTVILLAGAAGVLGARSLGTLALQIAAAVCAAVLGYGAAHASTSWTRWALGAPVSVELGAVAGTALALALWGTLRAHDDLSRAELGVAFVILALAHPLVATTPLERWAFVRQLEPLVRDLEVNVALGAGFGLLFLIAGALLLSRPWAPRGGRRLLAVALAALTALVATAAGALISHGLPHPAAFADPSLPQVHRGVVSYLRLADSLRRYHCFVDCGHVLARPASTLVADLPRGAAAGQTRYLLVNPSPRLPIRWGPLTRRLAERTDGVRAFEIVITHAYDNDAPLPVPLAVAASPRGIAACPNGPSPRTRQALEREYPWHGVPRSVQVNLRYDANLQQLATQFSEALEGQPVHAPTVHVRLWPYDPPAPDCR